MTVSYVIPALRVYPSRDDDESGHYGHIFCLSLFAFPTIYPLSSLRYAPFGVNDE